MFFANEMRIGGLGGGSCLKGSKIVKEVVIWVCGTVVLEGDVPCGKTVTVTVGYRFPLGPLFMGQLGGKVR